MNRTSLLVIVLAGAVLGLTTTASAQHHHHRRHGGAGDAPAAPSPAAPDPQDAEYQPAIEAANRGQREEALTMFRAIFERTHAPRAQARMGTTEVQLGRWLAAEEHLQGALAASQDPWVTAHRGPLMEALGRVQQNLADLEVVCPVEGAELSLNGRSAGVLPLPRPVRVERGNVIIDVVARGYESARRTVAVTSGNARAEVPLLPQVEVAPLTAAVPGIASLVPPAPAGVGAEASTILRTPTLTVPPDGPGTEQVHRSRWYGWQTLIVDGVGSSVVIGFTLGGALTSLDSSTLSSSTNYGALVALFAIHSLDVPIVHWLHGRVGAGLKSLAIRGAGETLVVAGYAMGESDFGGALGLISFLLGVGVGIAAIPIDAAIFARTDETHPPATTRARGGLDVSGWTLAINPLRGGANFGVGGRF